ncbi:MAG: glycerophosphodiester phosphodiesterase [Gemmatimonadota bacterium]
MIQPPSVQLIAHRGYSAVAPENTLAALEAALAAGADAVEFDLQTAACGTPVLFHDPMLGRTTNGVGPLRRRPLAHLKALDAGSWFGPEFAHEKIPTLEEALTLLEGQAQEVHLDIKGYREMEDLDRMAALVLARRPGDSTVLVSSDWVVLNRFRQVAPELRRSYLVEDPDRFSEAVDRAVVDEGSILSVAVELAGQQPEGLREAREAGVELMTWTVDDADTADWALSAGFLRIATNQVEALKEWRASRP